jgi:CRISPR-associated endonuclease Cas2
VAERLGSHGKLMVIFDVSERTHRKRDRLRCLLRNLDFQQVQKSVWITEYDHRDVLVQAIKELELANQVLLYECLPLITD